MVLCSFMSFSMKICRFSKFSLALQTYSSNISKTNIWILLTDKKEQIQYTPYYTFIVVYDALTIQTLYELNRLE